MRRYERQSLVTYARNCDVGSAEVALKKEARRRSIATRNVYEHCHLCGIGVKKYKAKAMMQFQYGSNSGDPVAAFSMGVKYFMEQEFDLAVQSAISIECYPHLSQREHVSVAPSSQCVSEAAAIFTCILENNVVCLH